MAGTRFILKTGKMLGEKRTEIRLRYRPNSLCLSCADTMNAEPNQLVIEVYPSEGIRLTFSSKVPGYVSRCQKITWPRECPERHSFQYPLEGYKEP
jgi:glucose-6-phosphate 1-dehydrogenase